MTEKKRHSLYREILSGARRAIIWGVTNNLVVYNWLRQTPASFIVDTQWDLWNKDRFAGLPVYSPSEIGHLPLKETVVFNHYCASRSSTAKIEDFMKRLGGYAVLPPVSLHHMASFCARGHKRKPLPAVMDEVVFRRVQTRLRSLIKPPGVCPTKMPAPLEKLVEFFASYDPHAYMERAFSALHEQNKKTLRTRNKHVALVVGWLHPGGAERQLCNLAIGFKRAGWTPTVVVYDIGAPEAAHYRSMLDDAGVNYKVLRPSEKDDLVQDTLAAFADVPQEVQQALWHLRPYALLRILHHYKAFRALRPELVVTYMDESNTAAGVAAVMAGVPRVTLTGRSVSPHAFPHFFSETALAAYEELYGLLLRQPNVVLTNNSVGGAASYAAWLGIKDKAIRVIPNCITDDFTHDFSSAQKDARRKALGLSKGAPLVLGVFRLAPEKRPEDFVRVIAAMHRSNPALRAVICGADGTNGSIARLVRELGLEDVVQLPGAVHDVPLLMQMATLLLHTSEIEGAPNVVIEAQASGLPIICVENSGTRALVDEAWKGFMRPVGDIVGLTKACTRVIEDRVWAIREARKVRVKTLEAYSMEALTSNVLRASGREA